MIIMFLQGLSQLVHFTISNFLVSFISRKLNGDDDANKNSMGVEDSISCCNVSFDAELFFSYFA